MSSFSIVPRRSRLAKVTTALTLLATALLVSACVQSSGGGSSNRGGFSNEVYAGNYTPASFGSGR